MLKTNNEEKVVHYFIDKYPDTQKDITLFKIILTPLELYSLKLFLIDPQPKRIRDIQLFTIRAIFTNVFYKNGQEYKLLNLLHAEGYGLIDLNLKLDTKLHEVKKSSTIEDEIKNKTAYLRKYKVKCPSYELIQSMVENLEKNFILKSRTRDDNSKFFIINPNFYIHFKDNFKEILAL